MIHGWNDECEITCRFGSRAQREKHYEALYTATLTKLCFFERDDLPVKSRCSFGTRDGKQEAPYRFKRFL